LRAHIYSAHSWRTNTYVYRRGQAADCDDLLDMFISYQEEVDYIESSLYS
jgi:hypothetical protein